MYPRLRTKVPTLILGCNIVTIVRIFVTCRFKIHKNLCDFLKLSTFVKICCTRPMFELFFIEIMLCNNGDTTQLGTVVLAVGCSIWVC